MQIQALHTAHKSGWTPAYDWWADHQENHTDGFASCAVWIENVPVLPATVLGLELLLQDRSLHLQMAADLILKDLGATLHVLRLVKSESPASAKPSLRVVDCLASLDVATWFGALASHAGPSMKATKDMIAMWKHCRSVAQYAKLIAESLGEVSAEDAYLAGLLHEVDTMSSLFGKRQPIAVDTVTLSEVLPAPIMFALHSAKQRESASVWRYVLASAHALATTTTSPNRGVEQIASRPFVV